MDTVKNRNAAIGSRVAAVDRFWAQESGLGEAGRERLKSVAWSNGYPAPVRVRALELLAAQPGDAARADLRTMTRLMLPTETDLVVVEHLGQLAVANGWTDHAGPLARSWSRPLAAVSDERRPERAALLALFPGQSVEQTLFALFSTPATGEGRQLEWAQKARLAAWEVLARLDPRGVRRGELLASLPAQPGDALVTNLRAAASDLRAVPITDAQLTWVNQARRFDDPVRGEANRVWWTAATRVIAGLPADKQAGLALRHAEPIRWASEHRPEWLAQDRAALLARATANMKGRERATRASQGGSDYGTSLNDQADKLSWADLLTLLVIDEAVRAEGQADALWAQAEKDRADRSTEYGGLISWVNEAGSTGGWRATLYPPRPTQRLGDDRFVASDEMLADGATALTHYHFHAQRVNNADYAGPGPGDLIFANEQGRACVVFTPIRRGVLAVSYYQPGSVVVDLGTIAAGVK